VYGGGPGAASATGVSNASGRAAPEAIMARRLMRGFMFKANSTLFRGQAT
jgi:hypothetical protein